MHSLEAGYLMKLPGEKHARNEELGPVRLPIVRGRWRSGGTFSVRQQA
jgi:hypothetical protein